MIKADLVVIDPQNDFCVPGAPLFVQGADADCERLATMITRIGSKLNDIHVTLDSHHVMDIAHPRFWVGSDGKEPGPFTIITKSDVENGTWRPFNPSLNEYCLKYVTALETNGRYPLNIWPPHCLIGTPGNNIQEDVMATLLQWEYENYAFVDKVTKGSNWLCEHYSAVQADVPDPNDNDTQLNVKFIATLQEVDLIIIAGQALDFCVANTFRDIANNFGEDNIKKMVLCEDLTSSVNAPGCEHFAADFMTEMIGRGMQVSNSIDILA